MSPTPFVLSPVVTDPTDDSFTHDGRVFHWTHSSLLELEDLLATTRQATSVPLIAWSFCQEDTSYQHEDGHWVVGHKHTHFAGIFHSRINLKGARKFDVFLGVDTSGNAVYSHPNVQKCSMSQMQTIMTKYHLGRKYDIKKGQETYKEPIKLEQKLPQQWAWTQAIIQEVVEAPDLISACVAADVKPRSVTDIRALRDEAAQLVGARLRLVGGRLQAG